MSHTWRYLAGGGALLLAGLAATQVGLRARSPESMSLAAPTATLPSASAPSATAPQAAAAAPEVAAPEETDDRLAVAEAEVGRLAAELDAARAENAELRATLQLRDTVLDTLRASVAERDAALADVRARLASNEAQLAALNGRMAALSPTADFDRRLAALKGDAGPSAARLEPAAATADLFVPEPAPAAGLVSDEAPVVEVQFDFASAALTPGGTERAALAAATLSGMALERVRVVGHTDRVGHPTANRRLAARRADAVARFLVASGLPADVIVTDDAGETGAPVATGDGVPEPLNRSVAIFARAKPTS